MSKLNLLALDKYGWPVERIKGRPITNLIRLVLHTKKVVCRDCWYSSQAKKNSTIGIQTNQPTHA